MGIFDSTQLFTTYETTLRMRGKLMGGVPKNPKLIEEWLRSVAGIEQQDEVKRALTRTLLELGADVTLDMSFADLEKASAKLATMKQTNGFKSDDLGLYIEDRQLKALLKEATNILYAGDRWGKTLKGPKSFLAERVFVQEPRVYFEPARTTPDGVDLFIGHTSGARGQQSNLTYYEYVEGATISFTTIVAEDAVGEKDWPRIWVLAQELGIGALRSQSYGRFDIERFELKGKSTKKPSARALKELDALAGLPTPEGAEELVSVNGS